MVWGNSIAFQDYPVEEALRLMKDVGFGAVEMWRSHLQRCKTDALCQQFAAWAEAIGLKMAGLNVVGEPYYQPFGTDEQLEKTLTGLKADLKFALALGSKDVLIWEGVAPEGTTEAEWLQKSLPRLVELFRAATSLAAPVGARFLVEPHPYTVGMSDRLLTRLYDTLDSPHFGITYDCCHYGIGRPTDYVQAVKTLGKRIRHIHFSDSDQVSSELHFPPGHGCLDLTGILNAFKAVGFDGTLTLDLYGYPLPVEAARVGIPHARRACDFLGITP